jgi:predicted small metal-binding protein
MYQLACGSPVCEGRLASSDKEELMRELAEHLRTVHRIEVPSKSILGYLEATALTEVPADRVAG